MLSRRSSALRSAKKAATAGEASAGLGSGDLTYHGGSVMPSNTTYAIYWVPAGYSVSAHYESLINGFFSNVAAASGGSSNTYSVTAQYSSADAPINYQSSFAGSVVDTDPFPANACTDGSLPVCLTDGQLQSEIDKVISAQGWQAGSSSEFFIFTPPPVGSCFDSSSSTCAYSYYCAYHGEFASSLGNGAVIYANVPYAAQPAAPQACDTGERPNGDDADPTINLISHEHAESITDPLGTAWYDQAGYEIGDKCAWTFGQLLGNTGGADTNTDYNEQIGAGTYYLQEEWSNQTFDPASGEPGSCVQRDMPQLVLTGPGDGSISGGGPSCSSEICDLSAEEGTSVTLTAHPTSDSSFVGWQGDCSGTGTCTVTVSPLTSVSARFESSAMPAGWAEEPIAPPAGVALLPPGSDPQFSFSKVAEAANGTERATTVYNQVGGCGTTPSDSSGIFLQHLTGGGWAPDGTLIAPQVGRDAWSYWPSCNLFGSEIALSADGSTLLASEDMASVSGGYRCAGFIYERGSSGWTLAATLYPPGIDASGSPTWSGCDYFGINSVLSADGQRAVFLSSGLVDIFVRTFSGSWALEQHIVLPTANDCNFTIGPPRLAISSDGSRLLVGAPDCTVSGQVLAGSVYDFERSGSSWSLAQTIDTPEPIYNNYFGQGIALSSDGNTAVVGTEDSTGLPDFAGAAWVYEHDGSGWHERVRLAPAAPEYEGFFACPYVSDDGSEILCTAFDTVGFDQAQGSLYAFQRPGSSWTSAPPPVRFFAGDGHAGDNLGKAGNPQWWFDPAVATPAAGGDVLLTINSENAGDYGNDRIGVEFTTAPVIRSFAPSQAVAGTQVTITGANFSGATTVTFNGVEATSFVVDSASQITANVPSTAGVGAIGVATSNGSGWSSNSFAPLPELGSISPTHGLAGTPVTISGTNLGGATAVAFDGTAASAFQVDSSTEITANVPPTASGGSISVTTAAGTATSPSSFSPEPAVTTISPTEAVAGAPVTISGTNLADATAVTFDGVAAASFHVDSPTEVTAVVPGTATAGPVSIRTPGGTAASPNSFRPLPAVSSIAPAAAVAGTSVTITGTNLGGANAVTFNGVAAASYIVDSATEIKATVPASATEGSIDVTTPAGSSSSSESFDPLPAVDSFSPGSATAGQSVTISGTNLSGATAVAFDGVAAIGFMVGSPTRITATVPATATSGQISVTTPAGRTSTGTDFRPLPVISSFSPRKGKAGAHVTIRGTNLADLIAITVGGRRARSTSHSPTRIVVTVPRNAGKGSIRVRTAAGIATSRRAFQIVGAGKARVRH